MARKKILAPVLLTSGVWLALMACSVAVLQNRLIITNPSDQVVVYRATKPLNIGDKLEDGDFKPSYVNKEDLVDDAVQDVNTLADKKVIVPIRSNEQIVTDRIVNSALDIKPDYVEYAVPVTMQTVIANTLRPLDTVDIMLNYQKSIASDVVVPKVRIFELRAADGTVAGADTKAVPAFALFYVPKDAVKLLDDASKKGTLYLARYSDANAPASSVTYKPSY